MARQWTADQCKSQRDGLTRLLAQPQTKAVKHAVSIARQHLRAHCKESTVGAASLLNTLVAGTDSGRSTTTGPDTGTSSGTGLLATVGTIIGGAIGVPGVGQVLGTIGDAYVGTAATGTGTGRATATAETAVTRIASNTVGALGLASGARALGLVRVPRGLVRAAKVITRWQGVAAAAEALGLTVEQAAYLATKPTRRRGITAASLRTTKRVLRQITSINRSLKHWRKPC